MDIERFFMDLYITSGGAIDVPIVTAKLDRSRLKTCIMSRPVRASIATLAKIKGTNTKILVASIIHYFLNKNRLGPIEEALRQWTDIKCMMSTTLTKSTRTTSTKTR